LKIYPNGNHETEGGLSKSISERKIRKFKFDHFKSSKNEEYISIYLQLKKGAHSVGKYRHLIEIHNYQKPEATLSR